MSEEKRENTTEQHFDKKQVYTDEVIPLMKQINEVCVKHGLPHMVWVIFSNDERGIGQGLVFENPTNCGFEKMAVLANIADGNLNTDHLAAAALAFKMADMLAKSDDAEKKAEVK